MLKIAHGVILSEKDWKLNVIIELKDVTIDNGRAKIVDIRKTKNIRLAAFIFFARISTVMIKNE